MKLSELLALLLCVGILIAYISASLGLGHLVR